MNSDLVKALEEKIESLEMEKIQLEIENNRLMQRLSVVNANDEKLAIMQSLAKIFSWEVASLTGRMKCSAEMMEAISLPAGATPQLSDLYQLIHPEDLPDFSKRYEQSQINAEPFQIEHRIVLGDSDVRIVRHFCQTFIANSGIPLKTIGLMQDMTTQRSLEKLLEKRNRELKRQAVVDDLTGLKNRRSFNDISKSLWSTLSRLDSRLGFIIIDIDNFKTFNDNYGHDAGDLVLKKVSELLASCFRRGNDYLFRIGGEEFCVLTAGGSLEDVMQLADKLLRVVSNSEIPHKFNADYGIVTISIGVSFCDFSVQSISLNELYRLADQALYLSKGSGRNHITRF